MDAVEGMQQLIGTWESSGEMHVDGQTLRPRGKTTFERLGAFLVMRAEVQPQEFPDSVSIIGGGEPGQAAPMHYFDERGVRRQYLTHVEGNLWTVWRADDSWRESPGFNQRFRGEISPDGQRIVGAWERGLGEHGDRWEVDFELQYRRVG